MKFTLLSFFLLTAFLTHAQFMKGDKFVGGSFSINTQKSTSSNDSENQYRMAQLSPSIGYFLNSKYAVGGGVSCSSIYQKDSYGTSSQTYRSRYVGLHAFAKRYVMISDKFFFMLTGDVHYSRGTQKNSNINGETKSKNYSTGLSIWPSLVFFPTSKWGIEGSIGSLDFSHSRSLSDDSKYTSFNFNYGTFSLGFAYYFRRPVE